VHTMFRCDSPELRDTLTNAWNNFVQQSDAALPLAEPVMLPLRTSPGHGGQEGGRSPDSFNQAQSDGQSGRHAGAREEASATFGRPSRRATTIAAAAPLRSATRGDSSSHLSALA